MPVKRIKAVREALHLSRRAFGEKLGVSRDVISNIEYGRVQPKQFLLQHMCQQYRVNEHWLETGEGEMFAEDFKDDAYHTAISFRPYESIMKIDRKFSGSRRAIIHQRRCKVPQNGGNITFRMILDRFSVEIFVNHGEQTLSATMYTDQSADGFKFFADGKVSMDIEKYDLDADRE